MSDTQDTFTVYTPYGATYKVTADGVTVRDNDVQFWIQEGEAQTVVAQFQYLSITGFTNNANIPA